MTTMLSHNNNVVEALCLVFNQDILLNAINEALSSYSVPFVSKLYLLMR